MNKKSFIDIFVGLVSEPDKTEAKKIAKVLEKNGINSIQRLISMADDAIYALKGIGDRAMHIISEVKTKEESKAKKTMKTYKKTKGNSIPKDFKYYANECGISYLQTCQLEKILKEHSVKDVYALIDISQEEISQWKGVGVKRLQWFFEIKGLASKDR